MRGLAAMAVLVAGGTAHAGATFEVNAGVGVSYSKQDDASDTQVGGAWPGLAAGARFGDLAITARLSAMLLDGSVHVFAGPAVQWWASERVFLGAGLGIGAIELDDELPDGTAGYQTLGFSLRVGFNLRPERRHRVTVSLELTPGYYPDGLFNTGISLVAGYQYW
jgi:hypothetical protein